MQTELNISFDEILKEIQTCAKGADGFTSADMREKTGKSKTYCQTLLKKLIMAGKVYHNGSRPEGRVDGGICWVPVYKMKETKDDKGRSR